MLADSVRTRGIAVVVGIRCRGRGEPASEEDGDDPEVRRDRIVLRVGKATVLGGL